MNRYEAKQEAKRERLLAAADRHAAAGEARRAAGWEALREIPFGQPILVGHHSESRDRNYRARAVAKIDGGRAQMGYAHDLAARAAAIGTAGISQDDPDAVAKLRAELAAAETSAARAREINAAIRKSRAESVDTLIAAGITLTAAEIAYLAGLERIRWPLKVETRTANIRRIKERIAHLERTAATGKRADIIGDGWVIEDDPDENRIVLTLDSRISKEAFAWLRSMGWKWSRTRAAFLQFRDHYQSHNNQWTIDTLNGRISGGTA